ncbi:hypothetical protein T484DRAFT_3024050, partial [Baffinella frigidus]
TQLTTCHDAQRARVAAQRDGPPQDVHIALHARAGGPLSIPAGLAPPPASPPGHHVRAAPQHRRQGHWPPFKQRGDAFPAPPELCGHGERRRARPDSFCFSYPLRAGPDSPLPCSVLRHRRVPGAPKRRGGRAVQMRQDTCYGPEPGLRMARAWEPLQARRAHRLGPSRAHRDLPPQIHCDGVARLLHSRPSERRPFFTSARLRHAYAHRRRHVHAQDSRVSRHGSLVRVYPQASAVRTEQQRDPRSALASPRLRRTSESESSGVVPREERRLAAASRWSPAQR